MTNTTTPLSARDVTLLAMRLAFAAFLFAALTRTVVDADLWGHLLFGRDIVQLGSVPTVDHYSFTSDVSWINHEWLAEVITYLSYAAGGSAGLVIAKSLLLMAMLAIVLAALRPLSADPVVHDLLVFLAFAGSYGRFITFRPQVFSLVLFPALLLILVLAERGRPKALVVVPVIFLLWANLHGGWIVGLAALGVWSAWRFVQANPYPISKRLLGVVGAASIVATLVNPYGIGLWDFLRTTVGLSRDIADWRPIWNLPAAALVPWSVVSALVAASIIIERRNINPSHVAIVAMCWAGSIRVNRLDSFFVLSAAILLAPHLRAAFRSVVKPATGSTPVRYRVAPVGFAVLIVAALSLPISSSHFECVEILDANAPEPGAVPWVKSQALRGKMLTFFDWGEYAIWHLAPEITVSMDGRRETVYSEDLVAAHFRLYRDAPDASALVEKLQPDYIWLPTRLPVVNRLKVQSWMPIYTGPKSTILARRESEHNGYVEQVPTATRRCFPGP